MVSAMLHEFCVKRGEEQGKGPLKVVNKQTKKYHGVEAEVGGHRN